MNRGWQVCAVALCLAGAALGCSQGDRRPVVGQCRLYQECNGTAWLNKTCGPAYSFDSSTKTCKLAWNVDCYDAPRKCSKDGEKMEIPNSCRGYYECKGGQYLQKNCWFFQRFDTNTSSCETFWKVNCSSHSVCSGSVSLPVKGKCASYKTCQDGQYVEKTCLLPESVFDPVQNECVLKIVSKVNCTDDPVCSGAGRAGVAGDCSGYSDCVDGRQETLRCPWLKRFDRASRTCQWFYKVSCDTGCSPGDVAPSTDCSKYYKCDEQGVFRLLSCGLGFYFDVNKMSCLLLRGTCFKGECDLSQRKEVPGDCGSYMECESGTFVRKSCPPLYRYETSKEKCEFALFVTCDGDQRACEGNWTKGITCSDYQECDNGRLYNKTCGFFKSFDPTTQKCDWPWLVNCTDHNDMCTNSSRKPFPNDCRKYYQCVRGAYSVQTCLFGNYFDDVNKTCVAEDKARCAGRPKRAVAVCDEGEREVEPSSCSKYRQCDKGEWVTKSCSWLHKFNPADGQCHWSLKCFPNNGPATPSAETSPTTPDGDSTSSSAPDSSTSSIPDTPTTSIPDTPTSSIPETSTSSIPDTSTPSIPDTSTSSIPDTSTPSIPDTSTSSIPDTSTSSIPDTPTSSVPDTTSSSPDTTTDKPCTPGDTKPLGNSCIDFLLCDQDGHWVNKSCSSWCKHFNGKKCVWAWQYPCTVPTTSTIPPPCQDGTRRQTSDCKKYQECVSGKFVTKSCSWYEKFDPATLQCKKSWWPVC